MGTQNISYRVYIIINIFYLRLCQIKARQQPKMVNLNQVPHQNPQHQHLDLLQVRDKLFLRVVKINNSDYGT